MLTVFVVVPSGLIFETEIDADLDTMPEEVERLAFDAVSAWAGSRPWVMSDLEWEVEGFGPEYKDEPWEVDDDFPMYLEYERPEDWYSEDLWGEY